MLEGFSPVYVINLEARVDRRQYIEKILQKNNVTDYRIITAVDGASADLSLFVHDVEKIEVTKLELACTVSHLIAIEAWLNESNSEYAIIIEDDLSFETVEYWDKSFKQFLDSIATVEYEVIQLAISNDSMSLDLHKRSIYDYSSTCYLIKRNYAKKLIDKHKRGDRYSFEFGCALATAEPVLYASENGSYSIPLFTYTTDFTSSIHQDHIDFHLLSRNKTLNYWKGKAP